MRGRTNAEAGLQLNATVGSYEVASGENIVAGDFVETFENVRGGIALGGTENTIFQLSDGKFLCGGYLVERNNDGTFTRLNSAVSPQFQIATNFFCGFVVQSTTQKYTILAFYKYDPTTQLCSSRTVNIATPGTPEWIKSTDGINVIQISANRYILFVSYTHINNSNQYFNSVRAIQVDFSGTGYDDYTVSTAFATDEFNYKYQVTSAQSVPVIPVWTIKIQSDDYLVGLGIKDSTNPGATYYKGSSAIVRFKSSAYKQLSSAAGLGFKPIGTVTPEGYIAFMFVSSTKISYKYLYVDISDINTYQFYDAVQLADLPHYDGSNSYYRYTALKISSDRQGYDRYIIINSAHARYFTTCELYVATSGRSVEMNASSELASFSAVQFSRVRPDFAGIFALSNTYLVHTYGTIDDASGASVLMYMDINEHTVVNDNSTVMFVRGITSQNYIKGVAKTSGTSGDTIEVYIPQANN